ncbi:MAG: hypothetical protein ACI8RD_003743 [Bacillariaceae sp.]
MCIVLLLPLYYTAECDPLKVGQPICQGHSENTDFEQLTIMNVLPQYSTDIITNNGTSVDAIEADYLNITDLNDINLMQTAIWSWTNGVTGKSVILVLRNKDNVRLRFVYNTLSQQRHTFQICFYHLCFISILS